MPRTPQLVASTSAGRRPYGPTFCRATLRTSVPPFRTSRNWQVRGNCTRPTNIPSYWSATQYSRRRHLTSPPLGRAAFLLNDERAYPDLRPSTPAPWDHASLPFDGFLPPRHHMHIAHATAVLWVDRHKCLHAVVASPLLEMPSAENPTADCPLANHLHASPRRSWRRHQC